MKTLREILLEQKPFKEYVGKGIDPEKQKELHDQIEAGEIDIGPMPDHSEPVKDVRPIVDGETAWLFYKTVDPDTKMFIAPELRGYSNNGLKREY